MPIQGFTRLRRHQFGRQNALGNAVPATRAYPFSGVPDVNLNWTDPDGDFGSIDPIAAPTRGAPEITAPLTVPVWYYDDLPLAFSGFFGGAEVPTGGGTAKTWTYTPASLTADDFDYFTYQFGDDVTTDWFQLRDGIVTEFELSGEDQNALTGSVNWRFAHAASTGSTDSPVEGSVPTSLTVDSAGIPVYLKDMSLYIDSAAGSIGGTQILDALHSFRLRATQEVDDKRFANGAQEFEINGHGHGARTVELSMVFAKTADTVGTGSESDAWHSDEAVNRYVRLSFESTAFAQTAGSPDIPYSMVIDMPLRYYTRTDGEIGGNTTVELLGRGFYDATLTTALDATIVNQLTEAEFSS